MAAGTLRRGLLAQPGGRQRQRQFVLTQAGRALQQPGVATLAQQVVQGRCQPGRQRPRISCRFFPRALRRALFFEALVHDSGRRRTSACSTCSRTRSRGREASMRSKREAVRARSA